MYFCLEVIALSPPLDSCVIFKANLTCYVPVKVQLCSDNLEIQNI